jgi:pimeloyl-ACP methyl ester carboxylesterase
MLHGFPESALLSWHHQLQHFRASPDKYFVVAPDMRGYNQSDKPLEVSSYRLNELARDVIDIIDHYGKSYAIVVGHDWGAVIAWWTAISYPERVSKLAILNVPHPAAMQKHLLKNVSQLKKSWYMFFFQLPILPELKFARKDFQFPVSALATARAGTFGKGDIELYKKIWNEPNEIASTINYYRAAFRSKLAEEGKLTSSIIEKGTKVQPPTLVIWGKNDAFLEAEMATASVEEWCANGKLQFLDASHWVQHEEPALVNKYLDAFFESK